MSSNSSPDEYELDLEVLTALANKLGLGSPVALRREQARTAKAAIDHVAQQLALDPNVDLNSTVAAKNAARDFGNKSDHNFSRREVANSLARMEPFLVHLKVDENKELTKEISELSSKAVTIGNLADRLPEWHNEVEARKVAAKLTVESLKEFRAALVEFRDFRSQHPAITVAQSASDWDWLINERLPMIRPTVDTLIETAKEAYEEIWELEGETPNTQPAFVRSTQYLREASSDYALRLRQALAASAPQSFAEHHVKDYNFWTSLNANVDAILESLDLEIWGMEVYDEHALEALEGLHDLHQVAERAPGEQAKETAVAEAFADYLRLNESEPFRSAHDLNESLIPILDAEVLNVDALARVLNAPLRTAALVQEL